MSDKGFRGIPGVPEGWELVRIGPVHFGEWRLMDDGSVMQWTNRNPSIGWADILRKIETPEKYRPFNGGAEFATDERDRVGVDWKEGGTNGFYAVVSANASFVWVAFGDVIERFAWDQAFEKLQFRHADGSTSPFGAEVTE